MPSLPPPHAGCPRGAPGSLRVLTLLAIARGTDTRSFMKAKVYVTLKPSVLDPQGKAIKHSVELLGFDGIRDIRQGKFFEIAIDESMNADQAQADAEKLARDV